MKKFQSVLLAMTVILSAACGDSDGGINLAKDKVTYVQESTMNGEITARSWVDDNLAWWDDNGNFDHFDNYTFPNEREILVGTHEYQYKDYYWSGFNQYYNWVTATAKDYLYVDYVIKYELELKEFLVFQSQGLCKNIMEGHVKKATLETTYTGTSFDGEAEVEALYPDIVAKVGTTETTDITQNTRPATHWSVTYSVSDYMGTSDSGANFWMDREAEFVDVYITDENTINLIQRVPNTLNWGNYTRTDEEPGYY